MWINLTKEELDLIWNATTKVADLERRTASLFWQDPEKKAGILSEADALVEVANKIQNWQVQEPDDGSFIEAARAEYARDSDDDIEVNDDATVSRGDDGAFVMGWLWVSNEEAGLSFTCEACFGVWSVDERAEPGICKECQRAEDAEDNCRDCGEEYADGGDGYNGRCPSCADKAEAEGRSDD